VQHHGAPLVVRWAAQSATRGLQLVEPVAGLGFRSPLLQRFGGQRNAIDGSKIPFRHGLPPSNSLR
jgi:hypothetical protein